MKKILILLAFSLIANFTTGCSGDIPKGDSKQVKNMVLKIANRSAKFYITDQEAIKLEDIRPIEIRKDLKRSTYNATLITKSGRSIPISYTVQKISGGKVYVEAKFLQ